MTIEKGRAWGRNVPRPEVIVIAGSDAEVVDQLTVAAHQADAPAVVVGGGDLARTLGVVGIDGRSTVNELSIDLVTVRVDDDRERRACAHVVVRAPWWRGGWFRGQTILVMNAEFIGDWDVAPRGHPSDGRVEVFEVDGSFRLRQRLAARRRVRTGTHVPHPSITTRSVRSASWSFDSYMVVIADGVSMGSATQLDVEVVADAAIVYA